MSNYFNETDKNLAKIISERLTEILYQKRVSLKELAFGTDIQYNQISSYLRGEHAPQLYILVRICNFLQVSIEDVVPLQRIPTTVLRDGSEFRYVLCPQTKNNNDMETADSNGTSPGEVQQVTLKELSKLFSKRVVYLYKYLTEQQEPHEYNLSKSILRTGTAIGSTLLKADYPSSREEFYQSISIALDNARECQYWLVLLHETGFINEEQADSIIEDLKRIISILWAIIKKRKSSSQKSKKTDSLN